MGVRAIVCDAVFLGRDPAPEGNLIAIQLWGSVLGHGIRLSQTTHGYRYLTSGVSCAFHGFHQSSHCAKTSKLVAKWAAMGMYRLRVSRAVAM